MTPRSLVQPMLARDAVARSRRPVRWAWPVLAVIAAFAAVVGVVFGVEPRLDLDITSLVYDPAGRRFVYAFDPGLQRIRDVNDLVVRVVAIAAGIVLVLRLARVRFVEDLWTRVAVFWLATLVLAPGLIVNGILKAFGGRPRPSEVTQFGGTLDFVPWWSPFGRCDSNCSFVSGEMSSATWLLVVAVVLPTRWRAAAVAVVMAWAAVVGTVRIAMGGHFTSDVLLSGAITAATIWLVHGLVLRRRAI